MIQDAVYDLSLDVCGRGLQRMLPVKQGDSARCFTIRLTQGGQSYEIPADCSAVFTARKPDDTVIYNACTREEGAAVYRLSGQETNVPGPVVCELRLYDEEGRLLTSPAFCLLVEKTVYEDGAVTDSSPEFTALTELMAEARAIIEDYEAWLENAEDYATREELEQLKEGLQNPVYVAQEEPEGAEDGSVWIDTDEEPAPDPVYVTQAQMEDYVESTLGAIPVAEEGSY